MEFNDYQFRAAMTARYPQERPIEYLVLGLTSESGEVAGKLKKIIRDHDGTMVDEDKLSLLYEIGDIIWYCSEITRHLGANFGFVAALNLEKLDSRKKRETIHGEGDNR